MSGLFVVGSFVYWQDPAQHFRRRVPFPGRPLAPNEVWVGPVANLPERDIRRRQIAVYLHPDLVVLGSSRVLMINGSFFNSGVAFENLGVSGATVEDDMALWQILKMSYKVPKYIILGLDPWVVNANNEQRRWTDLRKYYNDFLNVQDRPRSEHLYQRFQTLWRRSIEDPLDNLSELWSWSSVLRSWQMLWSPISGTTTAAVYAENARPTAYAGYRADGSAIYPATEVAKRSLSAVEAKAREYALQGKVYSLSNWKVSGSQLTDLQWLLTDMKKEGSHVLIVLVPYQPLARRLIDERPGYINVLSDSSKFLETSAQGVPGIDFCNADDSDKIGCQPDEFLDAMHPSVTCMHKVVTYCFQQSDPWRKLLRTQRPDL